MNTTTQTPIGAAASAASPSPAGASGSATVANPSGRIHLSFLDGMRGLAALYVVLFHIVLTEGAKTAGLPAALKLALLATNYGHVSVGIFIVLSGCCLMIPVARSSDGALSGGLMHFFKRRAWRILPPYYAALIFSVVYAVASMRLKSSVAAGPSAENAHSLATAFVTHVLMIHDLSPHWTDRLNSPMWSVAVEWQIYFLFALILLPVWRRFGNIAAVALAFVLGYLPHLLLPTGDNFDWACPWYLGLFTMGMVTANAMFPRDGKFAGFTKMPWGILAAVSFAVVVICLKKIPTKDWMYDPVVGVLSVCIIAYCWKQSQSGQGKGFLLTLLSHRWLVLLGGFSYSLYLIHRPIQFAIAMVGHKLRLGDASMLLLLWATLPVVLLLAYAFFTLFERPFLSSKQKPIWRFGAAKS